MRKKICMPWNGRDIKIYMHYILHGKRVCQVIDRKPYALTRLKGFKNKKFNYNKCAKMSENGTISLDCKRAILNGGFN